MKTVNKPFRKKDAMQLVTGQPVYMDDIIPQDCLIVKLLRSPHANAIVRTINTAVAKKVPGIEAIFTWEDVPQDARRYTQAGQTYPEASPYDRLLIDRHVRFVGDVVAIVAGKDEKCVDKALKLIKVDYEVLEAVLDFHTAKDNPILVHPEDNWESLAPVGADNKRNLCAHDECGNGDIDAVLAGCDVVIDHVYHTKACQQAMMETFRTYCSIDTYGRLNVLSSTQIVFHARRNIANALHIPKSMVRVSKPRIGGGFGAKQTAVSEVYPAFVTWKTKKPSKITFSRVESQTASSPRHEMEVHVRLGATKDGVVKGIDLYTLSNTGAYGEHGPTTVGLSGHKSIPMYRTPKAFRFAYDVVYTNRMSAGAYRGYGATQGIFAVESAVSELARSSYLAVIVFLLPSTKGNAAKTSVYFLLTRLALVEIVLGFITMILGDYTLLAKLPFFALAAFSRTAIIERYDAAVMGVWVMLSVYKLGVYFHCSGRCLRYVFPKLGSGSGVIITAAIPAAATLFWLLPHKWESIAYAGLSPIPLIFLGGVIPLLCLIFVKKGARSDEKA